MHTGYMTHDRQGSVAVPILQFGADSFPQATAVSLAVSENVLCMAIHTIAPATTCRHCYRCPLPTLALIAPHFPRRNRTACIRTSNALSRQSVVLSTGKQSYCAKILRGFQPPPCHERLTDGCQMAYMDRFDPDIVSNCAPESVNKCRCPAPWLPNHTRYAAMHMRA